jgi:elongation factor P--(R)-beta-lysine ligase
VSLQPHQSAAHRRRPAASWPARTHHSADLPPAAVGVVVLGRLTAAGPVSGAIADERGTVAFSWPSSDDGATAGDIVAAEGETRNGAFSARRVQVLVTATSAMDAGTDWTRFNADSGRLRCNLRIRAQVQACIREFFVDHGYLEVETPIFVSGTGMESHLDFFHTEFCGGRERLQGVLAPSPEHHMKRLLGAGFERIFQLTRCFRNGERSALHNPEFTMLEWYRAYSTYDTLIEDVEALTASVMRATRGSSVLVLGGDRVDLARPWPQLTVTEAFDRFGGVRLDQCADAESLRRAALAQGASSITADDSWEDAFHKLLIERVEPGLASMGAVFLKDYPIALGALARRKSGAEHLAERVEAYVGGIELANGFGELNDPAEQAERFQVEARRRDAASMPAVPLDEPFLRMLSAGMAPAAGMALGVDRLVMLCSGAATVGDVIAFPQDLP